MAAPPSTDYSNAQKSIAAKKQQKDKSPARFVAPENSSPYDPVGSRRSSFSNTTPHIQIKTPNSRNRVSSAHQYDMDYMQDVAIRSEKKERQNQLPPTNITQQRKTTPTASSQVPRLPGPGAQWGGEAASMIRKPVAMTIPADRPRSRQKQAAPKGRPQSATRPKRSLSQSSSQVQSKWKKPSFKNVKSKIRQQVVEDRKKFNQQKEFEEMGQQHYLAHTEGMGAFSEENLANNVYAEKDQEYMQDDNGFEDERFVEYLTEEANEDKEPFYTKRSGENVNGANTDTFAFTNTRLAECMDRNEQISSRPNLKPAGYSSESNLKSGQKWRNRAVNFEQSQYGPFSNEVSSKPQGKEQEFSDLQNLSSIKRKLDKSPAFFQEEKPQIQNYSSGYRPVQKQSLERPSLTSNKLLYDNSERSSISSARSRPGLQKSAQQPILDIASRLLNSNILSRFQAPHATNYPAERSTQEMLDYQSQEVIDYQSHEMDDSVRSSQFSAFVPNDEMKRNTQSTLTLGFFQKEFFDESSSRPNKNGNDDTDFR